tara:strand:+ start:74 stop:193 length:120 start_codon:yes stop_codon:yes gene_type:complete
MTKSDIEVDELTKDRSDLSDAEEEKVIDDIEQISIDMAK